MFPPFPQALARHYCVELISKFQNGTAVLEQVSKISEERAGQGVMIGSLVCWNEQESRRVVLFAVSGISKEIKILQPQNNGVEYIVVPPIVDSSKIIQALAENDGEIHRLTEEINRMKEEMRQGGAAVNGGTEVCQNVAADNGSSAIYQKLTAVNGGTAVYRNVTAVNECGNGYQNVTAVNNVGTTVTPDTGVNLCHKNHLEELQAQRKQLTTASLQKVFNLYSFHTITGCQISLNQIIDEHNGALPPTGTGDCCAPKLLSYAFSHNLRPVSMDEVFYGRDTKNKVNGQSYGPCDERCGYILPQMLGLEIIYRDSQIVVVNKPSGLLSVPGRGEDKQDCVVNRLRTLIPQCIQQPSVHRLDMETSGLMVFALTQDAHRNLNAQFAEGKVHKKYEAVLDGILEKANGLSAPKNGEKSGQMELPFRLDIENRPHQIYDEIYGKIGITRWENAGAVTYVNPADGKSRKVTKVIFTPLTGRTHQLRLAASDIHGFGLPIIGDTLYGTCQSGQRLMLNAFHLEFYHPVSGRKVEFTLSGNGQRL